MSDQVRWISSQVARTRQQELALVSRLFSKLRNVVLELTLRDESDDLMGLRARGSSRSRCIVAAAPELAFSVTTADDLVERCAAIINTAVKHAMTSAELHMLDKLAAACADTRSTRTPPDTVKQSATWQTALCNELSVTAAAIGQHPMARLGPHVHAFGVNDFFIAAASKNCCWVSLQMHAAVLSEDKVRLPCYPH